MEIDELIEITDSGVMWRTDNNPRVQTQVVEEGEIDSDFELPFSVKNLRPPVTLSLRHSELINDEECI